MPDLIRLQQEIAALLAPILDASPPPADADLFDTGLIDSLAFIELLAQLERTFEVKISLDGLDIDQFRSIAAIARFVARAAGLPNGGAPAENGLPAIPFPLRMHPDQAQ